MFIPPLVALEFHSKLVIATTYIAHLIVECIGYIPLDRHQPPIALTTLGPFTLQIYYTTSSSNIIIDKPLGNGHGKSFTFHLKT
jgi:hypothetical protein